VERAEDKATRAMERAEDKAALDSVKQDISSMKLVISSVKLDISSVKQDISSVKQDISSIKLNISSQASTLEQMAQAVVTQAVAGQVEQCAPSTALYLEIGVGGGKYVLCSAVPMFFLPRTTLDAAPATTST
jgi:hypothetical protein